MAFAAMVLSTPVRALELGSLHIRSALGDPLHVAIDIRDSGDQVVDSHCFRIRHLTAGDGAYRIRDARLAIVTLRRGSHLEITTRGPIADPVLILVVELRCGTSHAWEYAIPMSPAATDLVAAKAAPAVAGAFVAPGRWRVRDGESLSGIARALYPRSATMQARFVEATHAVNPGLPATPGAAIAVGTELVVPDLRLLNSRASTAAVSTRPSPQVPLALSAPGRAPARRVGADSEMAAGKPAATPGARSAQVDPGRVETAQVETTRVEPTVRSADSEPRLRLATSLGSTPATTEARRKLLRLEYRLISAINIQAASQQEIIEKLRVVEETEASLRTLALPAGTVAALPSTPASLPSPGNADGQGGVKAALPSAAPVEHVSPVASPLTSVAAEQRPAIVGREQPSLGYERLLMATAGLLVVGAAVWLFAAVLRGRRSPVPVFDPGEAVTILGDVSPTPVPLPDTRNAVQAAGVSRPGPAAKALAAASAFAPTIERTFDPMLQATEADLGEFKEDRTVVELAEMMMGFGRVHGAAELLREYIHVNPDEALKPWVMLLDVYRQAGMAENFEKAAWRLHKHFNVQVEEWDTAANLSFVAKSIEAYPHIIARLVATWRTPQCLEFLHHLLKDNRSGERAGFARETVEELVLLIDILERDAEIGKTNSSDR